MNGGAGRARCTTGCLLVSALLAAAQQERTVTIGDFGAVGDGASMCTVAIQRAIDRCAEEGGGTVLLPAGRWLTGTVYLRSSITLCLEEGCILPGSRKENLTVDGVSASRSEDGLPLLRLNEVEHAVIRRVAAHPSAPESRTIEVQASREVEVRD